MVRVSCAGGDIDLGSEDSPLLRGRRDGLSLGSGTNENPAVRGLIGESGRMPWKSWEGNYGAGEAIANYHYYL